MSYQIHVVLESQDGAVNLADSWRQFGAFNFVSEFLNEFDHQLQGFCISHPEDVMRFE